ncbi:hypothetical protein FB381_3818 [Nocardioides albertanoniae]|uniref:Uncharacterized protein n=1 Tax=Nocardioides albertanoniae TaxID=1175486 RepID=A0A543ABP2_9ACTN|nr:hypothetical protein [Nocardioides albertanoniae]TQL69896.1 hypothetical protein FB381_3818 [Nocardioides albertanoniae]
MSGLPMTTQSLHTSQPAPEPTPPQDKDIVAGWTAFAIFIALCVAVALIGWSLLRQFKKVEKAKAEGVFGEEAKAEAIATQAAKDEIKRAKR